LPIDDTALLETDRDGSRRHTAWLRNIKTLPTLPVIVRRVRRVADGSDSSANELADFVSEVGSVTTRVELKEQDMVQIEV